MARVQLPPDPRHPSCITTIVDSQGGDTAIIDGTMETIDAIVLVYDLSKEETFAQLEDHWLPLIERVYEGKVCAAKGERSKLHLMCVHFLFFSFHRFPSWWRKTKWIYSYPRHAVPPLPLPRVVVPPIRTRRQRRPQSRTMIGCYHANGNKSLR
jgi:hypothetical protein